MIGFRCDYLEGCHPDILNALIATNTVQADGYSMDEFCERAEAAIKTACEAPHAAVHFLVGGTQVNKTTLAWMLRPWQGVLSAHTGHIATHETGAIESTGHKVLTLPSEDGTITADQVEAYCNTYFSDNNREHAVEPGAVYVSHPTESGTLYSLEQLTKLREVCDRYAIPLYLDGARLAYALASPKNELTLPHLANLCHAFYIGGTKCGALCGEALVIPSGEDAGIRNMIKQTSGLLAKGRILGISFETLFQNDLYHKIGKEAIDFALAISDGFARRGIPMLMQSWTNQQFPILTQSQLEALQENYGFEVWESLEDGRTVVRFCTSWATTRESVMKLLEDIMKLS
ncbi:MAG: beta-eliminating lyase-related protein [Eubacteriales bacterium]